MKYGRVWAEINLDALNWNLERVRLHVGDRKLMVAVKADAYGHGLREVAAEIADKVDSFGVAGVEEGISLRRDGIASPEIIVLSPAPYDEVDELFEHRLVPTVTEPEFARRLSAAAVARRAELPVHIEVDTGMGRTGIDVEEAAAFTRTVHDLPGLRVAGVFTHFPAADTDIEFTRRQVAAFDHLCADIEAAGITGFTRHAANSAGLMNVPGSHLDMVRPGLIVYGILPESYHSGDRSTGLDLLPVMSLRSRVVNLRRFPAGRSISYERRFTTDRDSTIAIVTAGYGDGYPYALTNRGQAIVGGRRAPVVGNVCMDLTMLDVTDVPDVRIGDPVTLLGSAEGDTITANEVAARAGTIPYEITCEVSPRVPRIYIRQGRIVKVRNLLRNTLLNDHE